VSAILCVSQYDFLLIAIGDLLSLCFFQCFVYVCFYSRRIPDYSAATQLTICRGGVKPS
jgi:hypothetical protein